MKLKLDLSHYGAMQRKVARVAGGSCSEHVFRGSAGGSGTSDYRRHAACSSDEFDLLDGLHDRLTNMLTFSMVTLCIRLADRPSLGGEPVRASFFAEVARELAFRPIGAPHA